MRLRDKALPVLAAVAVACGGAETQVVDNYFRAVAAKDNQTLSSFAVVEFDKVPQSWKVTGSAPESRKPAPLAEIVKKNQAATQGLAENKKAYNAYYNTNLGPATEVVELLKKGSPIPGRLAKVAEDWKGFTEKEKEFKRAVAETTQQLEREKRLVTVTVDGTAENYSMTLRKYEMKDTGGAALPMNRWVVTALAKK